MVYEEVITFLGLLEKAELPGFPLHQSKASISHVGAPKGNRCLQDWLCAPFQAPQVPTHITK